MSEAQRAAQLTVLEQIIARKRAELLADRALVKEEDLLDRRVPQRRGFRLALERKEPAIIAEIKRASPSEGVTTQRSVSPFA